MFYLYLSGFTRKRIYFGVKILIDNHLLPSDYVRLSKIATEIDTLKLNFAFVLFYKMTRFIFLKNIASSNPFLLIFVLYRLVHLCNLNSK